MPPTGLRRNGAAEVEQPVVVPGRAPDEHVLDHLLRDPRGAAVADEIGSPDLRHHASPTKTARGKVAADQGGKLASTSNACRAPFGCTVTL